MAKRPDNILESEKILGTIHIALGDNSSFGGNVSTPFHQDFVFFRPTVILIHKDGNREILMKEGRFSLFYDLSFPLSRESFFEERFWTSQNDG